MTTMIVFALLGQGWQYGSAAADAPAVISPAPAAAAPIWEPRSVPPVLTPSKPPPPPGPVPEPPPPPNKPPEPSLAIIAREATERADRAEARLAEVLGELEQSQAEVEKVEARLADALARVRDLAARVEARAGSATSPKASLPNPASTSPPSVRSMHYIMKDANGQAWTHTDPTWLAQWVAQQPRPVAPTYSPPAYFMPLSVLAPSACAGGRCP